MYRYHANLSADHPFTSDWYTWPLMLKPVWLYVSYPETGIKCTITGIRKSCHLVGRSNCWSICINKCNKKEKKIRHIYTNNDTINMVAIHIYRKSNVYVPFLCNFAIYYASNSLINKMDK